MTDTGTDSNISALSKLRELPRGTHVESRIAAIKNLLGDVEIFRTIKKLRWPLGVVCPKCHSPNVIAVDAPENAPDNRQYYECLDCQKDGDASGFDDLTGLPFGDTLHELREWVLCWYLIGFCSISQIARVLGLSMHEVIRMAEQGSKLSEANQKQLNELEKDYLASKKSAKKKSHAASKKEQTEKDELYTRSESRGKFKPGPKSSA
jgi:transposase-like protein